MWGPPMSGIWTRMSAHMGANVLPAGMLQPRRFALFEPYFNTQWHLFEYCICQVSPRQEEATHVQAYTYVTLSILPHSKKPERCLFKLIRTR